MFDNEFINKNYETGDIISYEDLMAALGDGYGDPGNADIATLGKPDWYPCGFCSPADCGVWDPDETKVLLEKDYGKTWVAVCSEGIDGWAAADAGISYLLDMAGNETPEEIYYTIHFEDEGTGENFDDFVFISETEALCSRAYDYPGYGTMRIKKINREKAKEILYGIISDRAEAFWIPGIEEELKESPYLIEAQYYIEDKEPGWQLLQEMIS